VEAVVVKPAHVFHDRELQLGAGAPHSIFDQFGLERVHEALREGVVVGVADGADRRQDAVVVDDLGVVKDVYCLGSTGPRNSVQ
jgi:hypothetical protein